MRQSLSFGCIGCHSLPFCTFVCIVLSLFVRLSHSSLPRRCASCLWLFGYRQGDPDLVSDLLVSEAVAASQNRFLPQGVSLSFGVFPFGVSFSVAGESNAAFGVRTPFGAQPARPWNRECVLLLRMPNELRDLPLATDRQSCGVCSCVSGCRGRCSTPVFFAVSAPRLSPDELCDILILTKRTQEQQ